ncbi:MAG: hypothetical protein EAZ44_01465 [Cytophagia bacterium]|nr:MAG: hypothetical protein EAY69_07175 [Cytophagales bacterium]TAG06829.1 MAG: hypothetical protein EAZ44_01465 [Cytophagia bacterium]TAG43500.1 MAG: hypothetical protein EAZ31_04105 [Cytophagia bacterium]TAH29795.1 MAG: hypothetical protein EAZ06_05580 [Cytophagales bacterium]
MLKVILSILLVFVFVSCNKKSIEPQSEIVSKQKITLSRTDNISKLSKNQMFLDYYYALNNTSTFADMLDTDDKISGFISNISNLANELNRNPTNTNRDNYVVSLGFSNYVDFTEVSGKINELEAILLNNYEGFIGLTNNDKQQLIDDSIGQMDELNGRRSFRRCVNRANRRMHAAIEASESLEDEIDSILQQNSIDVRDCARRYLD